jgi:hypothetical protein
MMVLRIVVFHPPKGGCFHRKSGRDLSRPYIPGIGGANEIDALRSADGVFGGVVLGNRVAAKLKHRPFTLRRRVACGYVGGVPAYVFSYTRRRKVSDMFTAAACNCI